ncbi:MAG: OB-fold nucleic acid binding domain-containing protein, partial [Deltaproteobacteria bacterium]|nr:OB-fold nucleic acid binding domain-containing protein [Deltaproteobacteria bacterium]
MADEKQLIADRQKKADELRSLGVNPYANGFVVEHDIGPIVSRFGAHAPEGTNVELEKGAEPAFLAPDRFTIAGRIMAIRGFGKMSFVKLADRTGDVQVWLRKDKVSDAQWEVFKRAERGDFLGVTGAMTYTKTG